MGNNTDDRKWLHDKMVAKGYDVGSYNEFEKSIQNKDDADWYYQKATDMGLDVGSRDDFEKLFVGHEADKPYTHKYDKDMNLVGGTAYEDVTQGNVKQYIIENKPDMFVGNAPSLMDAPLGVGAKTPEFTGEKLYARKERANEWAKRPITEFGEAFEQGSEALYQGGKNLVGETANLFSGSQRDFTRAQQQLKELVESGYDLNDFEVQKALKDYKDRDFQRKNAEWQKNIASRKEEREGMGFFEGLLHRIQDPSRPKSQYEETGMLADEVQLQRAYYAIEDALKQTNGDVSAAFNLLGEKSAKETWGDKVTREAREELSKQRPTEGFGAWVGGMLPQMVGNVGATAARFTPWGRWLTPLLGYGNMAYLTGSTSGMSMAEARDYAERKGIAANEGEVWRTGMADAAIEYATEKIPFNRYFGKAVDGSKNVVGKWVADAVGKSDAAATEMGDLLSRASKEFGAGIFSGKNVKDYLLDVGTEGLSEFTAEALQTITPMIYQNPEDYPTLKQIWDSGLEGAKGGLFMGAFLGAGNRFANRYQDRKRREKQGEVTFAETKSGVFEVLGVDKDGQIVAQSSDGESVSLTNEEVIDQVTVPYEEFKNASMDKAQSDAEVQVETDNAIIDSVTDPSTGKYAEVNRIMVDEHGETVTQPGYVVGWIGEAPIFLPEGAENTKENRIPLKPNEWDPASLNELENERVKAINEEMVREEAAVQAERESKYAPEVLSHNPVNGDQVIDANGKTLTVTGVNADGVVYMTEEGNIEQMPIDSWRDLIQAQIEAQEAVQEEQLAAEQQAAAEVVGENVSEEIASSESVGEQVNSGVNVEVNNSAPVIPTKEDGSIDFVAYGKDNSFRTLGEKYGEKMPNKVAVTAKALAADLKKAQEKLAKAEEDLDNAPIGREAKQEAARDKAKADLEAVKREADFWADMDADIKAAQAQREAMLNPQAEIEATNEPLTAEEFVAQQLASGNIVLDKEEFKNETGYGDDEVKALNGGAKKLIVPNGGMSIRNAGDRLMELASEEGLNFFDQDDANSGRNVLLEVLSRVRSRKELNQYIANNRAEQAKRESEGLRNEFEKQVVKAHYESLEDFVLQNEAADVENPFMEERAEEIMAIFAEEAAKYEQSLNNVENGQGTTNEVAEGSDSVLSSEQTDDSGRIEEQQESERVGDGIAEQGKSAHVGEQEGRLTQREGETTLQFAERVAEESRRKPLRERANEWAKALGVQPIFIENIEDAPTASIRAEIEAAHKNGKIAPGWVSGGKAYFFLPDLSDLSEVDKTFIHEVVAHKGLKEMLGEERFNALCDKVWDMMPQSEKDFFTQRYPIVKDMKGVAQQRAAADEYMAHLSEKLELTPEEKSIWDYIVQFVRDALDKALNGIIGKSKITDEDIAKLIKMSYANLKSGSEGVSGEGTRFSVIERANEEFNKQLDEFKNKTHRGLLSLGAPQDILRKIGVNVNEITISPTILHRHLKKHHLDIEDLKGLASAIQNPILSYKHGKRFPNLVIVTEMNVKGGKLSVSLELDESGSVVEISNVKSVHSKEALTELQRLSELSEEEFKSSLKWVEKEKVSEWLLRLPYEDERTIGNQKLNSIANIINSFENPKTIEEKSPSFRVIEDKNGRKSLVGLHNISEEKLKKAMKQGGLANPSMAVINIDKQSHIDYGEITLVAPANLIDKKTGKNIGTYTADAYTPIYPTVTKQIPSKGEKALKQALEIVDEIFRSKVKSFFNSYLDNGSMYDALYYWYLADTGKNPPTLEAALPEGYTKEELDKVKNVNPNADAYFELSDSEKQKIIDLYAERFYGSLEEYKKYLEDYKNRMKDVVNDESKPSMVRKRIQNNLKEVEEYGYEYDYVAGYYSRAITLASRQSKPSDFETFRNAHDEVVNNNQMDDFNRWLSEKEAELGVEEKLFAGYDNQGRAKYVANTLENASKLMKKEGRAGATGFGGFNKFISVVAPIAKTLEQIKKKKSNLSDQKAYDVFKDKWGDVYHDLAQQLQPGAYKYEDYGYYRLEEMPTVKNPKEYVKKEYGIDLSDEFMQTYNEFISAIKNDFPARYFETKFERPVYLNEFAAAVVPQGTSSDVVSALTEAGLPVEEYERGNNEARMAAVDKVSSEIGGIRFRFIGERGARNLDKAEEATTRLDNLSVAREMEADEKDAKTIKMATGWERGADGLWRYETMDSETAIKDGDEVEIRKQIEDIEEEEKAYKKKARAEGIDPDEREEAYIGFYRRRGFLEAQLAYVMAKNADVMTHISTSLYHVLNKVDSDNLFKAYPELEFVKIGFATEVVGKALGATVINGSRIEAIHLDVKRSTPEELNGYLAHEIQHAIQEIEGFAPGGDPSMESPRKAEQKAKNISFMKDKLDKSVSERNSLLKQRNEINDKMSAWWDAHKDATREDMLADKDMQQFNREYDELSKRIDKADNAVKFNERWFDATLQADTSLGYEGYKRLAGEVEARNVTSRLGMTLEQRRSSLASETEDVAREDQIFLKDGIESGMRFRISKKGKQIQAEVDKFTSKYDSRPVVVIDSAMTDKELEAAVPRSSARGIRRVISEEWYGGYSPESGDIYIFADNIPLNEEIEDTLFHENLHRLFQKYPSFVENFSNEKFPRLRKGIVDLGYPEDQVNEELLVRVAARGMTIGDLYDIEYNMPKETYDEFIEQLKAFGYDYKEEDKSRVLGTERQGTGRLLEGKEAYESRRLGENEGSRGSRARERKERLGKLFDQVGDMGLEGVLEKKEYRTLMVDIFKALPDDVRTTVAYDALRLYGGSVAPAVSDYIGAKAKGSVMDKIVSIIREALRKVGFDLDLNANEVRYLAWRSKKPLDRNNLLEVAEDIDMKNRLKVGEYDGTTPDGGGTRFRTSEDVLNQIKQARKEVEKNPSEAQKEAGNYKKGHISLDGFEITLENPKGGTRSGIDKNGKKWSITMNNDYGYIRGTKAVDGDHIDVFLSDNPTEGRVFVVDQLNEEGFFDESKVMYGFDTLNEARDAYLSNYEKGWEKRIMDVTEVSKDEFKKWIDSSHKKTKAFSEYKNVKSGSNDIRFRVANKLKVRDEYEATIKKGGYQAREAVQDAMLSLRRFQELIEKASGKKVRDFENAWMHENRLSSTVQSEIHEMERKFYKPMINAVKKLMKVSGLKEEQVADYLMLKHGIERNREMAVRKALTDDKGKIDRTKLEQWYQDKRNVRNRAATPHLDTWRKQQEELDNIALLYGADMSRDYSGLTSMFNTDDVSVAVTEAYNEVESLENAHQTEAENLGKAIKAMTQNTLDKAFSSGLMDRKVYDELSKDMYDYYIPLRGFEETTSDEVYAYMDSDRGAFNAPLKRAKGRSSKADNPIAYLKSIAESGIMQGERNQMKQTFLNLVTNNPSDLVSVREGVWAMYNPATDEWEAVAPPQLPNNATPADVENAMEAWEQSMEQKAANNPDVKKISEADDVPYRVIGNRMNQHQVIVKRLGKSYTLTINGNPRLAMALNGMTNPNNRSNDGKAAAFVASKVDALNRNLAAWYTTRNPDFVASNFMRDTFYTNTIVRAKEGNHYANHFHKHYAKLLMPGKMIDLFRKYENGTLDLSKPMERDFHEFMMNGGETGYSNLKDLEDIKKQISKELKGSRLADIKKVADKLDILNRAVENTARFAAYRTSRQVGRSVARSIFDAKEISVNFNKKGAGGTFFGATGQTKFGNMAAMVGAGGRALYVFFNAAVQGTTNLLHVMKVNPKGTSAGLSAMFLMGAVLPYLFGGDDDDEKDYYDIPEHVRRNHLIVPGLGDAWISIPLPIEYRIMYGMGELLTSWRTGHERGENIARKMLNLTGQALPLNFLEEGLDAFMPSALSPIWQVYNNESWTGLPIYKDNEFNKDDPEYAKAYKNVDRNIYNFTKALYEWTFDEESQEEGIDLNPAVIESLAKGYFGGLATQLSNVVKTYEMVSGEREFDWRNIPVANRLFKTGDERTKEKRITNEYFKNLDKLEFLQSRERLLKKTKDGSAVPQADKDKAEDDLKVMKDSDVYKKYMEFKKAKKTADKIYKLRKTKDSPELEKDYYEALDKANKALN